MSEKDVKDNETEALNNAAAENADIEAGETDMATSIESVDFAVVYDDGGDSIATESAENAENTEGIATEDSVASDNANRVNETLALARPTTNSRSTSTKPYRRTPQPACHRKSTAKSNIIARRTHSSSRRTRHSRSTM